ncbi:MAG: hypothetical protein GTO30_08045 [Acidobacteria bacterium]|nr:hypothetical protein [Acidobacteriota bacterium]NIQ85112.1 hypothetical protein [Acidobacteriota bacterium]
MKSGLIGALVGLLMGVMVGTALFGPLGGVVGLVLGATLGFVIVTPLSVMFVRMATEKPFTVTCPETNRDAEVTLNPREAGRAELWGRKQQLETCTRFEGRPTCHQGCLEQIEL